MKLEVIATCIDDALTAEACGADRIELITAMTEGGLTPGIGLVRQTVKALSIPVHVMIRPHSRSFVYGPHDADTMAEEIQAVRAAGAAGIVVGALTGDGRIDVRLLERLLPLADGMQVTYHRAFDELADLREGLDVLKQYPAVTRVLTSGGPLPAPLAVPVIRELVERCGDGPLRILAGHGLTPEGIEGFCRETGVGEVHFGSSIRFQRSGLAPIDPEALRALAERLHTEGMRIDRREG